MQLDQGDRPFIQKAVRVLWPNNILLLGLACLYMSCNTYLTEAYLHGERGADAPGVVEHWRAATIQGGTVYDADYSFRVGDHTYQAHYHCQCAALQQLRAGDSLTVRYAKTDPRVNRPAADLPRWGWLPILTLIGVISTVTALHAIWRRRALRAAAP
jgi:hypothetical protein